MFAWAKFRHNPSSGYRDGFVAKSVRQKNWCAVVENPGQSRRWIAKQLGIVNSTVSRVIKSFEETQTTQRRTGSGRKAKTISLVNARKVRDYFKRFELWPRRSILPSGLSSRQWSDPDFMSSRLGRGLTETINRIRWPSPAYNRIAS